VKSVVSQGKTAVFKTITAIRADFIAQYRTNLHRPKSDTNWTPQFAACDNSGIIGFRIPLTYERDDLDRGACLWNRFKMEWSEAHQLRHAARCSRLGSLRDGRKADILDLERELRDLGYDGLIGSLSADNIVRRWKQKGWIEISPNGSELRLTTAGIEQFAQWEDEDALWEKGTTDEIKNAKRLKAGEPATNLRKLAQLIGDKEVTAVHDPYIDVKALETVLKLKNLGVKVCNNLHLLSASKRPIVIASLRSFLGEINKELSARWEVRTYQTAAKPHRRFLVLQDSSVVTCGVSLNDINKDEALEHLSRENEAAEYDCKFFYTHWESAQPVTN
jgi:hypothetical protein